MEIDVGKAVYSLAGQNEQSEVVLLRRSQQLCFLDFLSSLSPSIVRTETFGAAQHNGRSCLEKGHEPQLMSRLYVRPYVKVHKMDGRDAEGSTEAATRPTMPFVQLDRNSSLIFRNRATKPLDADR